MAFLFSTRKKPFIWIIFSIKLLEKVYNSGLTWLFLPLSAMISGILKEGLLTSFLVFLCWSSNVLIWHFWGVRTFGLKKHHSNVVKICQKTIIHRSYRDLLIIKKECIHIVTRTRGPDMKHHKGTDAWLDATPGLYWRVTTAISYICAQEIFKTLLDRL